LWALKKRFRNGDNNVATQINGRPRKMWLLELGYSSDIRYMDKVMEEKEQHAELCKLLAAEGYDVVLLPIVLGSAVALFKCLDRATKEMDIPNARKKKLYSKLHLQPTKCCVPTAIPGETKARNKRNNKRQIASLPTPTCP
jgi:hypothetical protein